MDVKTLIFTELLDCGYADIELLENIDEDILIETLEEIEQEDFSLLEVNFILEKCFTKAINDINNHLNEKFNTNKYKLSKGFSSYHNYLDTHAYLDIEKARIDESEKEVIEIIERLFKEKTGFNLSVR